jgi:phage baseplate assembly protein V
MIRGTGAEMSNPIETIKKVMEPMAQRVILSIARASIRLVKPAGQVLKSQIDLYADETRDNVDVIEHYGFTSNPPVNSQAVCVFVGGDRSHGVVIATQDQLSRVKNLKPGEVALFTNEGDSIIFHRGNKIDVTTKHLTVNAANDVTVNTDKATVNATTSITATTKTASMTTQTATVNASTSATVTTPQAAINASAMLAVTAPVSTFSGNVTVAGMITGSGGLTISGGSGAAASVTGNFNLQGTLTNNGINMTDHTHGGVESGGSSTGTPQ